MYLAKESVSVVTMISLARSRSMAARNRLEGSMVASSGGSSPWSTLLDRRSDPNMDLPGLCVICRSNWDKYSFHLDWRGDSRCGDRK